MPKFILPSVEIVDVSTDIDAVQIYKHIERCGRVCYQSEHKTTDDSYAAFIQKIIDNKHGSVLEHYSITVNFIVDRGVTHELVRHRIASYSQESQRYCNYADDKYGNEVTFVIPQKVATAYNAYMGVRDYEPFFGTEYITKLKGDLHRFMDICSTAEYHYLSLIEAGWAPQDARAALPNCAKTEINTTMNLREWMHVLSLRTSTFAHPDMRHIMSILQEKLKEKLPLIFGKVN